MSRRHTRIEDMKKLLKQYGIIDEDYHGAENEGHIIIRFTAEKTLQLPAGSAFAQGVFLPYGICEDDEADLVRQGGFGSTGN